MSQTIFQVRPRYTPGSPAQVDGKTAERFARQERIAYDDIMAFPEGNPGEYRRASLEGLDGIVEALTELPRGKGWRVRDLITNAVFERVQREPHTRTDAAALARDLDTLKSLVERRGADWVRKWTLTIDGAAAGQVGRTPDPRD